ncbi:MAG: glycosyltransferase [Chthoniobacteraceae bacterium]
MSISAKLRGATVFVGCGFAAKYRLGGGNFSVPLQWVLGLKRMGLDAIWLELFPATDDPASDAEHIRVFHERMEQHGLGANYCLLYHRCPGETQDLAEMDVHGITRADLEARLARANVLLNLSYSVHQPFLGRFERRVLCDLDPGEISYWMARLEMGQSFHDVFWTIGLNLNAPDCTAAPAVMPRHTFYPLVDTQLFVPQPRPERARFTTVTQWYWGKYMEVNGTYPELSKQAAFEQYMTLPSRVPEAEMELAVNLNDDDPERDRIRSFGWHLAHPHQVASGPVDYRQYIASSLGEFTPVKQADALWKTGWFSDRAAAYLATGRPEITEDTTASRYLPEDSGVLIVSNLAEAEEAVRRVIQDWERLSKRARETALECFDSVRNLEKILASVV